MSATNDREATDTRTELTPRVLGYEFLRKLGQGGMGAVYLVRQRATGRLYALKVIVPESAASEKAMAMFLREISVLSRLDHPRIVRFHEMGLAQGQFYFAMEYVKTIDYAVVLTSRPGPGQIRAACRMVCQVLAGVTHAHKRGFIHRDIKPSNLLVGRDGAKLVAKLGDFGLAKSFENAGFSGMTRDGQALGTLAYMAPEQVVDARRATPSVDIYSAGATLYSLLAGGPPHGSLRSNELILAILEKLPERLDQVNPAVPRELALVIERALALDPSDRYRSAHEFREALLPFVTPTS
jgi:serine/threonine-protein kinase